MLATYASSITAMSDLKAQRPRPLPARVLRAYIQAPTANITPSTAMVAGTEFSEVRFHGDKALAAKNYAGVEAMVADDVADAVHWVATRPAHVNVNFIEVMPVSQAFAGYKFDRKP